MLAPLPHPLKGTCIQQIQIHQRLWKITFMLSEMKHFHAGQYLSFYTHENKLVGYFSIASAPKDLPFIWLYVRGPLHCQVGEELWISHPQGQMTIDEHAAQSYILCAGGTGVAPFLSLARSHESYPRWKLYWSMVHAQDEAMLEHLPQSVRVRLQTYLYAEDSDNAMKEAILNNPPIESVKYFLAGPMVFIEQIGQCLLDAHVPAHSIFSDLKKFH